jgi:hypothetical protein
VADEPRALHLPILARAPATTDSTSARMASRRFIVVA